MSIATERARNAFGLLAFLVTAMVIGLVLSPWVPESKEAVANVILGNVLAWPAVILAFHYGSTQSSADKNRVIAGLVDSPRDVTVVNSEKNPVPVDTPEPAFGRDASPPPLQRK